MRLDHDSLANQERSLQVVLDETVDYYRVHDMFSRILQIRIYEVFHQYFSNEKENKFLIGSKKSSFSQLSVFEKIKTNVTDYFVEKIHRFVSRYLENL